MLLFLYCLPLLFKVLHRGGLYFFCYIVYHYCLRFDRGVVHVVLVGYIVYRTVLGLTEEWFMLFLLYCLPVLF